MAKVDSPARRRSRSRHAQPFDVVELIEPFGDWPAGSRGIVVLEGIARAVVDFGMASGERAVEGAQRALAVPQSALEVVLTRTDRAGRSAAKPSRKRAASKTAKPSRKRAASKS